jgi:hypothetical protein
MYRDWFTEMLRTKNHMQQIGLRKDHFIGEGLLKDSQLLQLIHEPIHKQAKIRSHKRQIVSVPGGDNLATFSCEQDTETNHNVQLNEELYCTQERICSRRSHSELRIEQIVNLQNNSSFVDVFYRICKHNQT